jgi:predicted amidophosphoribosyltransferase
VLNELRSLRSLVFPPACLGCGESGTNICARCRKLFTISPTRSYLDQLPLFITARYQERTAGIVLAAKEAGNANAKAALAGALLGPLEQLLNSSVAGKVALLPMPSRASANRRRGCDHGAKLATAVCDLLAPDWPTVQISVIPIFRHNRRVKDQTGLTPKERGENLLQAFSLDPEQFLRLPGQDLVLLDDVITTGATVREGVRALKLANLAPLAVIAACASPRYFPLR